MGLCRAVVALDLGDGRVSMKCRSFHCSDFDQFRFRDVIWPDGCESSQLDPVSSENFTRRRVPYSQIKFSVL
jgi:hypothetical protein